VPQDRLKKTGATVHVVSLANGEIKGWDKKDWGRAVKVDKTLDEVSAGDYDAVVLPGGQINPDLLRVEPKALKFIKDIFDAKKASPLSVTRPGCRSRPASRRSEE
jgi:protease I